MSISTNPSPWHKPPVEFNSQTSSAQEELVFLLHTNAVEIENVVGGRRIIVNRGARITNNIALDAGKATPQIRTPQEIIGACAHALPFNDGPMPVEIGVVV